MVLKACVSCSYIPLRLAYIALYILQTAALTYLLARHYGNSWISWIIADVVVLALFICMLVVSLGQSSCIQSIHFNIRKENTPGYVVWIIYSIILAVKTGFIYWDIAEELDGSSAFGPSTLTLTVASSAMIFALMAYSYREFYCDHDHKELIRNVATHVAMDLLDSVAILDVVLVQDSRIALPFAIHYAVLIIGCISFALPAIALASLNPHTARTLAILKTCHLSSTLAVVNVPFFIIRLILWQHHSQSVSVFIIKNAIAIALALHDIVAIWLKARKMTKKPSDNGAEIGMLGTASRTTSGDNQI